MTDELAIRIPCGGCRQPVKLPVDGTAFFWTQQGYKDRPVYCVRCAVQYEAPLIKPQPKSQRVDGWDI